VIKNLLLLVISKAFIPILFATIVAGQLSLKNDLKSKFSITTASPHVGNSISDGTPCSCAVFMSGQFKNWDQLPMHTSRQQTLHQQVLGEHCEALAKLPSHRLRNHRSRLSPWARILVGSKLRLDLLDQQQFVGGSRVLLQVRWARELSRTAQALIHEIPSRSFFFRCYNFYFIPK
jgi:hypothetical protein